MHFTEIIVQRGRLLAAVLALAAGPVFGQTVPAPKIEVTGQGSYVVSYLPCYTCAADGLEEFRAASGTWENVGTGRLTVTNRAAGTYRYRVVYVVRSRFASMVAHGPAEAVVVGPAAAGPPLRRQFEAEYSVSSGDVDGDGRRDLLIKRLAGAAGAGTIGDVLLRRSGSSSFRAEVPSSYVLALAAGWPESPLEVRKRDVNIDGYVDLVLRGLGSAAGFTGVPNQIVFAPGASGSGAVPRLRAADAALTRFSRDVNRHLVDSEYYPDNAAIRYAVSYQYEINCSWLGHTGLDSYYGSYGWPCFAEPIVSYIAYRDYSGFDPDAIRIATIDYGMIKGTEPTETGLDRIAELAARVLGVRIGGWDIEDLVGTGEIESEDVSRGIELFSVLAGISEAVAQEQGEDRQQSRGSGNTDRVLLKGRRVLGHGPFHTALEYRSSTVSAYDSDPRALFDGRLVSEVDWPRDHPSLTLRMGYVDGPAAPLIYWGSIRAADRRYDDDLRYDLFPSLGQGGYNSNSFVSGLILATLGQSTVEMATFVGGEVPVPPGEFN
jgi:hypothetical protein